MFCVCVCVCVCLCTRACVFYLFIYLLSMLHYPGVILYAVGIQIRCFFTGDAVASITQYRQSLHPLYNFVQR